MTLAGCERTDTADLYADRGKIGKAAQHVRRHDHGFVVHEMNRIGRVFEFGELSISDKLAGGELDAEQLAHDHDIFFRDADQPHDGRENQTQNRFDGEAVIVSIIHYPTVE